jgi:hypothetical protein
MVQAEDRMVGRPAWRPRGRRSALCAGLAALVLAAAPGVARAGVSRVGVVVATAVNMSDADADALASRLGEAVRGKLEVDVVAGTDARRRLPPAGVPDDCVARPDCVRDVADRLGGDELLFLFVVRIGPHVQIDVTWSDPDAGAIASRSALIVPATGGAEEDRVFEAAPGRLLPHASPRAPQASEPDREHATELVSSPTPMPERRGRHINTGALVSGVVSVAALATGVGFAVAAREDYDQLEEDGCDVTACRGVNRRVDRMEHRALAADILFAGAGVAAATGIIFYLTSGAGSESRLEIGAAPRAGGGALLSLGGAF